MNYREMLNIARDEPVFSTGLLLTYGASKRDIEKQLSRWNAAGNVVQLRRGVYVLAEPYRSVQPHPFLIANRLSAPSYVSLQSALQFHGLIPESVPVVTSVTTRRPELVETPEGDFMFRHVKRDWFSGYKQMDVGAGQTAMIATPEKALLDLIHLTPGSDDESWLREMRLQNLDVIDEVVLANLVDIAASPKLSRAREPILQLKRESE